MASNLNRAMITGNLTRDPELRATTSGMSVLSFTVAVNDRRQVDGEWKDVPNYIDCVMFGKRAESIQPYMSKGTKVGVEGKLRWSSWESDGKRRSKIEVVADDVELLSRPKKDEPKDEPKLYEDDLPF